MELNTQMNIDEKVIDYINSLTITGMTLKAILRSQFNNLTEKELENKRKNFQRKLSKSGYKFDNELKIYVSKSQDNTSTTESVESQDNTSTTDLVESQDNTSTTLKPLTKKQKKQLKELEEKLKENPLYFHIQLDQILQKIDYIYNKREDDPDQFCMMIYPSLLKEFKKIEERFGYINTYYIHNCAILSCYKVVDDLKNSNLLLEYLDFISNHCRYEKKKQFNMRTYKDMVFIKQYLEKTFPILNKGDVIGFCFFAFLKCYEKSIEKQ